MSQSKFQAVVCLALSMFAQVLGCSSDGPKSVTTGAPTSNSGSGNKTETQVASPDPGYSIQEGANLALPERGTGYQIETPDYDANNPNAKNLIVQPNQEIFLCYYVTLPNTEEVDIGASSGLSRSRAAPSVRAAWPAAPGSTPRRPQARW
jgi:hypothetical protein